MLRGLWDNACGTLALESISCLTGPILPGPGEEEGGTTASARGGHAYQCRDHSSQGAEERGGEAGRHEGYGIQPKQTGQMENKLSGH